MHWIERNITDSLGVKERRKWPVYTRVEADEQGLSYSGVRPDMKAGEYILSDDGFVAVIVRVNGPYAKGRREYILPYCRRWSLGTTQKLNFLDFLKAGVFCWHAPKRTSQYEVQKTSFKKAMKRYAFFYITQQGVISEEQMVSVGELYRPDAPAPSASFKRMLKTHEAKTMLKTELKKLMKDHGVTPEHVISQHQRIIDSALDEGQLGVAEKANSKFIDMLDLMPDKSVTTTTLEGGVSWDHILEPVSAPKIMPFSTESTEIEQ